MNRKDYYKNNPENYIAESQDFDMSVFYSYLGKEIEDLRKMKIMSNKSFNIEESVSNEKINILDLAFGSARDMIYLKEKGFNIEGLDSCDKFVENAQKLGFTAYKEDLPSMESISKNKLYDLIYSVGLLMHLDKNDRIELFKNIKRNLELNGLLVLSYNTLDRSTDPEREFFTLNEEEINEEVGMTLINKEVMRDKRGFDWITATFIK